jgi:hypothetical protein
MAPSNNDAPRAYRYGVLSGGLAFPEFETLQRMPSHAIQLVVPIAIWAVSGNCTKTHTK